MDQKIKCMVPKAFSYLTPQSQVVKIEAGFQEYPESWVHSAWFIAHGVTMDVPDPAPVMTADDWTKRICEEQNVMRDPVKRGRPRKESNDAA